MGGNVSTVQNSQEAANDILTNIVSSQTQNCSNSQVGTQTFSVSNLKATNCNVVISNSGNEMNLTQSAICLANESNTNDLANKLNNALTTAVDNLNKGMQVFNVNVQNTSDTAKILNNIQNNITMDDFIACYNQSILTQTTNIDNLDVTCPSTGGTVTIDDVKNSLIAKAVQQCTANATNSVQSDTTVQNTISATTTNQNTGLDLTVFPGVLLFIPIIIGFLILCVIIYVLSKGTSMFTSSSFNKGTIIAPPPSSQTNSFGRKANKGNKYMIPIIVTICIIILIIVITTLSVHFSEHFTLDDFKKALDDFTVPMIPNMPGMSTMGPTMSPISQEAKLESVYKLLAIIINMQKSPNYAAYIKIVSDNRLLSPRLSSIGVYNELYDLSKLKPLTINDIKNKA